MAFIGEKYRGMSLIPKLEIIAASLKRELAVYRLILKDTRTPRVSKIMLGLAIGYLLLPFDLIPDWLPLVGQLDDLIIVPLLVVAAFSFIPETLIAESREKLRESQSSPSQATAA